ncbi:MAG: winged helix-turn-helix transcriptional regulator, partial [Bacteroidales bacterium]|nr:winged helix-turn-helix transcriptional regulator [Bacteroidales bacterium]
VIEDGANVIENETNVIEDETDVIEDETDVIENEANVIESKVNVIEDETNVIENGADVIENKEQEILKQIYSNNKISTKELSEKLNVNIRTVFRHLEKLKAKKMIERIGPDKGGYWKILNNNNL